MNRSIWTLVGTTAVGLIMAAILVWVLGLRPPAADTASPFSFVAPGGVDSGDCSNPASPCATVQYAVDQTDPFGEVLVAAGTYTGVTAREGVTQSVYITKPISIRGGYTASFDTPPDPDANPTILDADGLGRVLYIRETNNVYVDGFQLRGGNAAGLPSLYTPGEGGNVYILTATVFLLNNDITGGTAPQGAGLAAHSGGLVLTGNTFTANEASGLGGAIALLGGFNHHLENNQIMDNTAGVGGGGIWTVSDATLVNNEILSNTAGLRGGGLFMEAGEMQLTNNLIAYNTTCCDGGNSAGGGGIYIRNSEASLENNSVYSNSTHAFGGGIRVETSPALIRNNLILSNSAAASGGGIESFLHNNFGVSASPTLDGNTIMNNTANNGGGVSIISSKPTLMNNIIAENQATVQGSGISIGLSEARLSHTTLANNTGGNGSGISTGLAIVTFTNTIIVGHSIGITVGNETTVTMQATLWGSGAWANGTDWMSNGSLITTLDIHGDPAFVDAAAGDYHISATSAAYNVGVNAGVSHDIDGEVRPMGGGYDIGADEFVIDLPYDFYLPAVQYK